MSRHIIFYVYWVVLFMSFGFRHILILYADRGLVQNGQPNLTLFNQLYWVVVGSWLALGFAMNPGKNLLKGNHLLQDMSRGRACLLRSLPGHSSESQLKYKAIGVVTAMIVSFYITNQRRQLGRYVKGVCPNGRMSCFGKFRRNVVNLDQTYWWLMWWCLAITFWGTSISDYGQDFLSVKAQFWIWNITEFLSIEGLHIVLPLLLNIPSQGTELLSNREFYVRQPELKPRRPEVLPVGNTSRISNVQELESPVGQGQIQQNENKYPDTKKGHTSKEFHSVSVSVLGGKKGLGKVAGHATTSGRKSWGLPGVY